MFLSMLTADAAAQHGHEFSAPRSQPAGRRLPITRSPLSVLPSARHRPLPGPSPLGPGKRVLRPKRSRSLRVTMAELREEPEEDEADDFDEHLSRLKIPGAFHPLRSRSRSLLDLHAPQKTEPMLQQSAEAPAALSSPVRTSFPADTLPPVPSRRTPRPKTHYRLAHPPPAAKTKQINKHLRPRVLLQLQQQSSSGFHRPVFEIVPGSRFASHTRIGQKLNKLHKLKERQLAPDDMVVVQVEDSKTSDTSSEESENVDGRTVLGIICAPSKDEQSSGSAIICLDSVSWKATMEKDGRYDLELQGEEESQRARWYVPKTKRKRPAPPIGIETSENKKFYFATIQPNTTKHPTVAAMSSTHLDVYDSYSARGTPSHPSPASDVPASASRTDEQNIPPYPLSKPSLTPTDESLRKLIIVSAVWVFFREGWSPYFDYSLSPNSPTTAQVVQPPFLHQRSASMPVDPASPTTCQNNAQQTSANPIAKLVRSSTAIIRYKRPSLTPESLSRCNSNSLTPSATSSERSTSPALKSKKVEFREKLVRLATAPHILTIPSRLPSPAPSSEPSLAPSASPVPTLERTISEEVTPSVAVLEEPTEPPPAPLPSPAPVVERTILKRVPSPVPLPSLAPAVKQTISKEVPPAVPVFDRSADTARTLDDMSDDSDSPVNSPYWKDFDKLLIRTTQKRVERQMTDGSDDRKSSAAQPARRVTLKPDRTETSQPPADTIPEEQPQEKPSAVSELVARDYALQERSYTDSTLDSTRTQAGSSGNSDMSKVTEFRRARLRSKWKEWEARMKAKKEEHDAKAKVRKEEHDSRVKLKKDGKAKAKEEKAAAEKQQDK